MAFLVQWLGAFFAGTVGFLSAYITKRFAIAVAVIASFYSLTVILWVALQALWESLSLAFPAAFETSISCFVPLSVLHTDISLVISAYVARLTYDYYMAGLKITASAN